MVVRFIDDVLLHGLLSLECFCAVTSADIQKKVAMGTGKKRKVPPEERLSVEKVADRFNQVPIVCIVSFSDFSSLLGRRGELGGS